MSAAPQPPEWQKEIRADAYGVLTWSPEGMARYFAPDLPAVEAALLAATQAPVSAGAFDGRIAAAAFTAKPSWYVISDNDQVIPPALQQVFAEAMKATAIHVASSHVPMLSQPKAVADVIVAAVEAVR